MSQKLPCTFSILLVSTVVQLVLVKAFIPIEQGKLIYKENL